MMMMMMDRGRTRVHCQKGLRRGGMRGTCMLGLNRMRVKLQTLGGRRMPGKVKRGEREVGAEGEVGRGSTIQLG